MGGVMDLRASKSVSVSRLRLRRGFGSASTTDSRKSCASTILRKTNSARGRFYDTEVEVFFSTLAYVYQTLLIDPGISRPLIWFRYRQVIRKFRRTLVLWECEKLPTYKLRTASLVWLSDNSAILLIDRYDSMSLYYTDSLCTSSQC